MASTSLRVERRVFSNSSLASLRRNAEWFYAVAVFMSVMSGANPEADSHKPTADSAGQHGQRASIDFLSPADGGRYRIDVPLFVHLHLKTDGSNQLEHSLQMSATVIIRGDQGEVKQGELEFARGSISLTAFQQSHDIKYQFPKFSPYTSNDSFAPHKHRVYRLEALLHAGPNNSFPLLLQRAVTFEFVEQEVRQQDDRSLRNTKRLVRLYTSSAAGDDERRGEGGQGGGGGRERDSRIKTKLLYVVRRPRVRASIYIYIYIYIYIFIYIHT
jgi:hypothetical protein